MSIGNWLSMCKVTWCKFVKPNSYTNWAIQVTTNVSITIGIYFALELYMETVDSFLKFQLIGGDNKRRIYPMTGLPVSRQEAQPKS